MRQFIEQITGNGKLKAKLLSDITGNTFSHAYIIEGARGSGKRTLARHIAAALCCKEKNNPSLPLPCGECSACKKILANISPDVITVTREEDKATMGVDTVRFIRGDVLNVPNDLESKIYIIEEADKMTSAAQNAFLLTLEEPPKYVGFLLLCENAGAFLETIRSRAPVLHTEPQTEENIDRYILSHDKRASELKAKDPEKYAALLVSADGGIGNALALLEEQNFSPILQRRAIAEEFVDIAVNGAPSTRVLSLLSRFSSKREPLAKELDLLYLALRDIALIKKSDTVTLCFYTSAEKALEVAEKISLSRIFELIKATDDARERISKNANTKLTVTFLLTEAKMLL